MTMRMLYLDFRATADHSVRSSIPSPRPTADRIESRQESKVLDTPPGSEKRVPSSPDDNDEQHPRPPGSTGRQHACVQPQGHQDPSTRIVLLMPATLARVVLLATMPIAIANV